MQSRLSIVSNFTIFWVNNSATDCRSFETGDNIDGLVSELQTEQFPQNIYNVYIINRMQYKQKEKQKKVSPQHG